jgi:hypothetical protein
MIARIWHGMVPVSKADEYLDLMRRIALPEYLATRGNRGAWCLYRTKAYVTHFEMLTFWDDTDAIKRFAGDDYSLAKYYDFDSDYLVDLARLLVRATYCSGCARQSLTGTLPAMPATESSRRNVIAMQHTVGQIYGKAVARDVASLTATLTC